MNEKNKAKDYQNAIIECDIFRSDVMVHFGNLDGIKEVLSSFMTKDEIKEIYDSLYETKRGKTIILDKGQVIVYMPNIPTTPFDFASLQHELLHAVWFITGRVGITPSADSEEVYNYLLDYLTERVINAFSLTIRPT